MEIKCLNIRCAWSPKAPPESILPGPVSRYPTAQEAQLLGAKAFQIIPTLYKPIGTPSSGKDVYEISHVFQVMNQKIFGFLAEELPPNVTLFPHWLNIQKLETPLNIPLKETKKATRFLTSSVSY